MSDATSPVDADAPGTFAAGLGDYVTNHIDPTEAVDDAAIALRDYALLNGFPLPDGMGGTMRERLASIVMRLRGRRFLRDAGVQTVQFKWFEFHVPKGGQGSIRLANEVGTSGEFALVVFGSGFGGNARLSMRSTISLDECDRCHTLAQGLEVGVRVFGVETSEGGFREDLTIDPIRWLQREPKVVGDCCQVTAFDPFDFEPILADSIDASMSRATLTVDRSWVLSAGQESTVGLSVGPLHGAVKASTSGSTEITASWSFAPGLIYTPFVPRGSPTALPRWEARNV